MCKYYAILHGRVDNGISGIIIPCQPPRGDYNALSFLLNFPDVIVKFMECPCKLSEVENLLAPGIPDFLFRSSSTSGKEPKFFPKSCQSLYDPLITNLRPSGPGKIMQVYSISYKELLEVVTDSGEVVHTITSTVSSCGRWRTSMNWTIETDDTRMTYIGMCSVIRRMAVYELLC